MTNQEILIKERTESFNKNISKLNTLGFSKIQSFSILKRIKKHVDYCMSENQNFEETLFYVSQDFSFDEDTMEHILISSILSDEKSEIYFAN